MAEITFVIGGTRSGKSAIAEKLVPAGLPVTYIATCVPLDDELKERVERHKLRRPENWTTVEEPVDPASVIARLDRAATVFVECLSLLVFNLLENKRSDGEITSEIVEIFEALSSRPAPAIVVSNDVSGSLVATDHYTRRYQDLLGRVNQIAAAHSDRVILAVAGLPLIVKGK